MERANDYVPIQWFGPRFFVTLKFRIPQIDVKLMMVDLQVST